MFTELPSPELLRKLLRYEPETGKLFWRERDLEFFKTHQSCEKWNLRWAGKEAFTFSDAKGYRRGTLLGKSYKAHRIIWKLFYGNDPINQIDHINCIHADNRICNMREATNTQNQRNTKIKKTNKSGYKGVCFHKQHRKWASTICVDGKYRHLGYFENPKDASKAYDAACKKYHGEFGRSI